MMGALLDIRQKIKYNINSIKGADIMLADSNEAITGLIVGLMLVIGFLLMIIIKD